MSELQWNAGGARPGVDDVYQDNFTGALSPGSHPFAGFQWPSLGINLTSSVHARAVKQVAQGKAFFLEPAFMRYYL